MHRQAMSTWPVDNILGKMQGSLPEIAREAEVKVIVSKWDLAYRRPGIKFVDVTELMVRQFDPDAETLEIVRHVQAREPVPLEKLGHEDDQWSCIHRIRFVRGQWGADSKPKIETGSS